MKISTTFLAILSLVFINHLSAQTESDTHVIHDSIQEKTMFEPAAFTDNLYINAAFGTQMLFSKDAGQLSFGDRLTPSFAFGAGKWFSPYWGTSFSVQGYALNGFSTVDGLYLSDPLVNLVYGNNDPVRNHVTIRPDGSYRHFLRYIHANANIQLSMFNLIKGYDETRKWDVVPSIGLGYMHVFNYKGIPSTNNISTNFGLMGLYKYDDQFHVHVKLQSSVLLDQFDGRIAGNNYESFATFSVGVNYYLRKRGFKKMKPKIVQPTIQIIKEIDTIYQVVNKIDTVYVMEETPYTKAASIVATTNIKFLFDSVKQVDDSQNGKLNNLASVLIDHPELKLIIAGHTCNVDTYEQNVKIGMSRANIIKNYLVDLGVSLSQLATESKSFNEPLVPNINEENRSLNRRVELKIVP